MSDKIKTGNKGEEVAAQHLVSKGYEIVARNYRYKHAEIDLIVKKGNMLVFVEVKTRRQNNFGAPESFVTAKKAAKVIEGAEYYIFSIDWLGPIRFDIVAVSGYSSDLVEHFEDAFH